MVDLDNLAENARDAAAYGALGLVLMIIGFAAVDAVTPGNLRKQVWEDRSRNASTLVASSLLTVAVIIVASIRASEGNLATGLIYTLVYSLIGIVLMALSFYIVDLLTPGDLGATLMADEGHPAVWVTSAMHLGFGFVIAAAIL
ncbi:DUF350 domain-containing protein [Williamsia sp. CHRR-6]|uniref:DUF350 domain-containing protein n=1 Tax=Williamsia sp. CHRR-6 TaxID=2835871 RepID=UPI001BDAEF64|nr:DUF350 domain-containing protein [Williamsia sp. CHRR-6]MBT0567004.1 DUF350 domain-containing protein [Williamsia sp. CHRR-6]